MSHELPIRK